MSTHRSQELSWTVTQFWVVAEILQNTGLWWLRRRFTASGTGGGFVKRCHFLTQIACSNLLGHKEFDFYTEPPRLVKTGEERRL